MPKILLTFLFFVLSGFFSIINAENIILPSCSGIVQSIKYEDSANINPNDQNTKQIVNVKILTGEFKGTETVIDNMLTGNPAYDIKLSKGMKVVLHAEIPDNEIINADNVEFYIADIKRDTQLILYAGIFALLLLIIGKKKGLRSIVAIISSICLIALMVPAVLHGISPILSAITAGILSTVITVYLVGGRNYKSTSAIIGTSTSLIFAGILSVLAIKFARLTGFAGEESMFLYTVRPDIDFTGILTAAIIIASLGALMDTAVSIASTINEIHETDKNLNVSQLFKSGMNVGRDIIGTMSNTLILVYLGSSLPLVLLANNIDLNKFFNLNKVSTEILSALIGSIAILACVPLTAIITSILMKRQNKNKFELDKIELEP